MPRIKLTEIHVHYKTKGKSTDRIKITSSEDCYKAFMSGWDSSIIELQEEFKVLYLNRAHEVIGTYSLSRGGINSVIVDVRIIFATALKCLASSLIVAHNHPSKSLQPSDDDIRITTKLVSAGKILDIAVLDHLIISEESYYSFADEGMM